jgi:acetoacetate decarboxylase
LIDGTNKGVAVVLGPLADEAAPGNHGITSHPETGLTPGHVLRATSPTAYSFGAIPAHDHVLGDIKDAGTATGKGRIVVATSSGLDTIPNPGAVGQVLKVKDLTFPYEYEWGAVTSGVTSVTAGEGLGGGGSGSVTLNVNTYGGFGSGFGQTVIVDDKVAVVLGTDSANKAAPGIHTHNVLDIDDSTTVGRNLVKLADGLTVRFLRVNANNTVSALSAADMRTAIGAAATSHTHEALEISDSTVTGRAVLTAADAATARTAIGAGTGNGTITQVAAGNGLSGGASTGTATLTVNANGETVANRGQTALVNLTSGGQALAVVLGTNGFTAAAGNHTHNVLDIDDSTTVGRNLVKLADGLTVRFLRVNANNTVSALSAADMRTAIGAGTGDGTVSLVTGGLGLEGSVSSSGSINMGLPSDVSATTNNSTTSNSHTHKLDNSIADVTVTGSAPTGSPSRAGSLHFVV